MKSVGVSKGEEDEESCLSQKNDYHLKVVDIINTNKCTMEKDTDDENVNLDNVDDDDYSLPPPPNDDHKDAASALNHYPIDETWWSNYWMENPTIKTRSTEQPPHGNGPWSGSKNNNNNFCSAAKGRQ